MAKKAPMSPVQAQNAAKAFTLKYLGEKPLGIADHLSPEQFEVAMRAITIAMMNAWGDGYYTAREGK
jgi:hypothetical protein